MPDMYRVLVEQLTGQFNVPEEELTPQSTLNGVGLDSLALLELITILENEYAYQVELDGPGTPGPDSTLAEIAAWLERAVLGSGDDDSDDAIDAGEDAGEDRGEDDGLLDGSHGYGGGHEAAAGQGAR